MSELLDAVDNLTLPRNVKVQTDDGHTWASEDALLFQLEQAVSSSLKSGSGSGGAAWERNVLDSAALYQAGIIRAAIGDWCRIAGVKGRRTPIDGLRAWYVARLSASPDPSHARSTTPASRDCRRGLPECHGIGDQRIRRTGTAPHSRMDRKQPATHPLHMRARMGRLGGRTINSIRHGNSGMTRV
jgi:hypothetical protein